MTTDYKSNPLCIWSALASIALSVIGLSQEVVGQEFVLVETVYEYNLSNYLLQATQVNQQEGGGNGGGLVKLRRTETTYAHEVTADPYGVYAAMTSKNMLGQLYSQRTIGPDDPEHPQASMNVELACSRLEWRSTTDPVPDKAYDGCGTEEQEVRRYISYDSRNRPTQIDELGTSGFGLHTFYYYGTSAQPHTNANKARLTGMRRTGYGVGAAGWNDVNSTNPDDTDPQHKETYAYDNRGFLAEHTDVSGVVTRFQYDTLGRLSEVRDGSNALLSEHFYKYYHNDTWNGICDLDCSFNAVATITHTGQQTQRMTEFFDGMGRSIQTEYQKSTGSGDYYLTDYDGLGRPFRSWRPVNTSAVDIYVIPQTYRSRAQSHYSSYEGNSSSNNRPFTETTYENSSLGRPTFVREPGSANEGTTYRYGVEKPDLRASSLGSGSYQRPEGRPVAMVYTETEDADGRKTRTYRDGLGRTRFVKAGVDSADETLTEMIYDAAGRLLETRTPLFFHMRPDATNHGGTTINFWGLTRQYTYNSRGHMIDSYSTDALRTRYVYDRAGRVRYMQDTDEYSGKKVRFFSYDALGRLLSEGIGQPEVIVDGTHTVYDLDPEGTWYDEICTDQNGAPVHFEWCGTNRIRENHWDDPSESTMSSTYPGISHIQQWPIHARSDFQFTNTMGQLAGTAYRSFDAWQSEIYSYDDRGRVTDRWADRKSVV